MKIKKAKYDIVVVYSQNSSILFTAYLKKGIKKRADVANLIVNYFKESGDDVEIEFSEERYTPFVVKFNGEIREIKFTCVTHYICIFS